MKITFFLKYVFCISFLSVYTKHVLKHYDTLLYLKPNEKIQHFFKQKMCDFLVFAQFI